MPKVTVRKKERIETNGEDVTPKKKTRLEKNENELPETSSDPGSMGIYSQVIPDNLTEFTPELIIENRDDKKREEGIEEPEKTCCFFGKRGTGKTFILNWILGTIGDKYRCVWVMTKTKINGTWQEHVEDEYIFEDFEPYAIEQIIELQRKVIPFARDHPEKKINPNVAIVMDDIITDGRFKWSDQLDSVFTNGRHLKIALFITSQYAKSINTVGRGNIDWVFILPQFQLMQIDSLGEDFLGMAPKKERHEVINKFTAKERTGKEHQALAIAVVRNSGQYGEILHTCNAEETKKYKLANDDVVEGIY